MLTRDAEQLKDRERKKTGLMMAEAMREKMDLKEKFEGWTQAPGEVVDAGKKMGQKVREVGKGTMRVDVESLGSGDV